MSSKRFLLFLIPIACLVALAAEKPSDSGVIQLNHQQVAAMFAKGGPLLATNNFKVLALRRDGPGEVEVHAKEADVLYVLQGDATVVIGGTPTDPKTTAPGETRARSVLGGDERHLSKGDVMVIPNGVPHWFKQVKPPFLYFMVKVAQ